MAKKICILVISHILCIILGGLILWFGTRDDQDFAREIDAARTYANGCAERERNAIESAREAEEELREAAEGIIRERATVEQLENTIAEQDRVIKENYQRERAEYKEIADRNRGNQDTVERIGEYIEEARDIALECLELIEKEND